MGPSDSPHEIDDRQGNGGEHAVEDINCQDGRRRRQGDHGFAAAECRQVAKRPNVDELEGSERDDRPECSRRERGEGRAATTETATTTPAR